MKEHIFTKEQVFLMGQMLANTRCTLAEAKSKILGDLEKQEEPEKEEGEKPLSAKEKKALLKEEILKLGGEPPANSASVAVFAQALAVLKDKVAEAEAEAEAEELM